MGDAKLLERILDRVDDARDLPLALLKDITNDFSKERKIGQGGFGEVYKGVLGDRIVAVKRIHINENTFDDRLFRREFSSLCNIDHRNVVQFLGFCSNTYQKTKEDAGSGETILVNVLERLLCFEYISNGSLDNHITDELRGLEWETRYEIIIGICKGLCYLHKEKHIIHMDLKPANILLDHQHGKYMVPKITDFGLSRPNKNSRTVGLCFGTIEYLAPEYRDERKTTYACDIYSLGLIILELVTGCKDFPNENNVLRRWRHRWKKPPTQLQYQQVTRCINIAKRCREQKPEARPPILEIISYLSESTNTYGQIIPPFNEDEMLGIQPLQLRLPSELKNEISFSVELTNDTPNCIAFNIQPPSATYSAQPVKGTVQPKSKCGVKITLQPRDSDHAEKFIVQSMQVEASEGLREEDIIERMSRAEACKVVDEVDLMIVYESTKLQENCKRREDTNMPAEEVPQAKHRKIVESTYEKGIQSSSKHAEETSMDINSSTRGHYTEQIEQCKLYPPQSFSRRYPTNTTYLGEDSRAVDVTRGAMGSLLDKLGKLVTDDYSLDTMIKRDIKSFSVYLTNIHQDIPALKNVKGAKIWVAEVRELSYHIEDMVDSFLVHKQRDSSWSGFKEIMNESVKLLENGMTNHHQMRDVIRDIKERVQDVADRQKNYNINVRNVAANSSTKGALDPRMGICGDTEQLIGIKAPIDELTKLFENDGDVLTQKLKIISIVGMGGLGKTTLAKAAYDKPGAYQHKAFVPVGQNAVLKTVLNKIIIGESQKYNEELVHLDEQQLIDKLKKILKDKRYFIVIDDLWDCGLWDAINSAFPRDNCGSRVITTTRIQEIVDRGRQKVENEIYKIKPLSDEHSRKLFLQIAFGPTKDCPPGKEEISMDILKRCAGMPLAINSIASHLARDASDSFWEHVRKSLNATKGNDIETMNQILYLSYIHLPDHLKSCLLHVCMYPEDRDIDKNDLLLQWVAEGFVCSDEGQDAEDVAEAYFKALIDMFMIQPGKIDYYSNEVLSCRVHDIILELMRSKSSKENFIHVIDGLKPVTGQIRRVSVLHNDKEDSRILETIKGPLSHARSVLLYRWSLLPDFLTYQYVRVLHLEDMAYMPFNKIILDLTGINRLFLLRYLKVALLPWLGTKSMLPDQIGELQQLETIDLQGCELENYPSDIVSLPWLSQLIYVPNGIALPDGVDRLKSLRTLVGVCVYKSSVDSINGLSMLTNLRRLQLCSKKYGLPCSVRMAALESSICKLSASLRTLSTGIGSTAMLDVQYLCDSSIFPQVSNFRELDLGLCKFQRCPEWIGQLNGLYKLTIRVMEVANAVTIVASLPSLAYFSLHTHGFTEIEETVVIPGDGAFKALKELIFRCPKASLTFEEGTMPNLEKLEILFRFHLARRFLPVGIEHLQAGTLKKIRLYMNSDKSFGNYKNWHAYYVSDERISKKVDHERRFRSMLERAFKLFHPAANIIIYFEHNYCYLEDSSDYASVGEEDDCCSYDSSDANEENEDGEDDNKEDDEEEGEVVHQVIGSNTSVQVQANTMQVEPERKYLDLNEAPR